MDLLRIAQLQTLVYQDKERTFSAMSRMMEEAIRFRPDIIALPEMFNCPYETAAFPLYAEREGGENFQACGALARRHGVYLSAGSMPETDNEGRIYNTAYVFGRDGSLLAKHRKVYLFDIDIAGGQRFRESDTLSPGENATVFDTEFGRMGLCICFDLRFPELSRAMVEAGATVIFVPAAFNGTTGPAHWELLFRARAVDNQVYTVGTAPSLDHQADYRSWGHSIVVDPWGRVLSQMDEKAGFRVTEIDLGRVAEIREQLPVVNNWWRWQGCDERTRIRYPD